MSCCPVRASHALLIVLKYILSDVVVRCLSITQCALVRGREPLSVSQVRLCDRTMLMFGLSWSAT
jgi:hypothetical protein